MRASAERNLIYFLTFFCSHCLLSGKVQDEELRLARAYYESEDYSHAILQYEEALEDGLDPWQNEILHYNIATSLLAEGKWEEALLRFQALSDEENQLPLLKQRTLSNLALAQIMQLDMRLEAFKDKGNALPEDYYQVSILFREAHQTIGKAIAAHCALEKLEGAIACPGSERLTEMRLAVKQKFDVFLHDFSVYRSAHASKRTNNDSLENALQQLSIAYIGALIKDSLQEADLKQILDLELLLEKKLKSPLQVLNDFTKSKKYLELSMQSLKGAHPEKARLFAEISRFYFKNTVDQIDFTLKTEAKKILENVIAKEEFILLLNHLRGQVREDATELADVDRLMPELQTSTLKSADQFLNVAIDRQKEAYSALNTEKGRCQCHPWDEVIPLFDKGYTYALLAIDHLKSMDFQKAALEKLQKKAVDRWKEALAKLQTSSSTNQTPEQKEKSSKQSSEKTETSPENEQQKNEKLNETLRLLQDMENDDRSKPQQLKTSSQKLNGEERPW